MFESITGVHVSDDFRITWVHVRDRAKESRRRKYARAKGYLFGNIWNLVQAIRFGARQLHLALLRRILIYQYPNVIVY